MATPAAILDIIVDANTTAATASLSRFDSRLKSTGTTATKAGRYTDDLNRRSSALGGTLRRAAGWAAGAAAAYLSISQAKAAVTTTQDLAKTTAGLNRNLGLTVKRGSQWGAVAKSRDIDTKALNMSFTTLSRRMTDASKGSDTAVDSFKDIGITERDLAKTGGDFNKQLLLVADSFGKAEGGAVRQQAAQKLLGRGYQTLLPMFAEGSKGLKEQFGWAAKYGAELEQNTLKKQMKLAMALRESKVAWLGLQVTFTKAITPALKEANKEFQKIAQIMGNDEITNAEKFRKVGEIIEKWADRAFNAFIRVLPAMAEKAGEAAPRIAGALVKGFVNSDAMGQLFLGAWFVKALGGWKVARGIGTKLGRMIGLGLLLALPTYIEDMGDMINEQLGGLFGDKDRVDLTGDSPVFSPASGGKFSADAWIKRQERAQEKSRRTWSDYSDKVRGISDRLREGVGQDHDRLGDKVALESSRAREKATQESGRMAGNVAGNVARMVNTASAGLKTLGENTNKSLKAFGAKKVSFSIEKAASAIGGLGRQRGGDIPGSGSGDKVPAMLEAGEYVLNRNAAAGIGKAQLDAINFGKYARFQAGGVAGLQPGISRLASWAADHHGLRVSSGLRAGAAGASLHNTGEAVDLVPPDMAATKGIFGAFRNQLAELFYDPWGGFDSGQMIGPIGGHLDHIHAAILGGGSGGAMVKKLARMILDGPKGPLRSMGQSALDKAHSAANKYLSRQTMSSHGAIGNISGPLQAIAQRMVEGQWGSGQWGFFNDLVMRESGWDPTAVNPSSGAAGLAQALPPSKYPAGAWPYTGKSSAVKQLQWMTDYISERYGNPAGAIAFHNANNWYQKGGEVPYLGKYHTGGPVLRDGMLHAQKGEYVVPSVEHRRHELQQVRGRLSDADDKATVRALTRQVELLEALLEQTKSTEREARERHRLERQTGAAFRDTGKRLIYDIVAGEIGSAMDRSRGWAGRGQLTATGRRGR